MRLVSACYADFYPFDALSFVKEFDTTDDPKDLKKGDILIVWGGADIPPEFYNKGRSQKTWASNPPSRRDNIEHNLMLAAVELGVPIIGVCRGGQMACAVAGGYLIQHVTGHGGTHNVKTYDDANFRVNSIHHQMMQPGAADHKMLAWTETPLSKEYWDVDEIVERDQEPEYIYFPKIKAHAIQWHPEGLRPESQANKYVLEKIKEFM